MRGMTGKHHSEKTKRLISKNSKRTGVSIKIINIKSEEIQMMRQIKYFHSVVRNNSFSETAKECHIS